MDARVVGNEMNQIQITPLLKIAHPKGDVYRALRLTESTFKGFGEAYFTSVTTGEIKGWKRHSQMTLNLVVPVGAVKFVIWDEAKGFGRSDSFFSIELSQANYQRLTVPPGFWMAFQGRSGDLNLILNIADIEHVPAEADNLPLDAIPYQWEQNELFL